MGARRRAIQSSIIDFISCDARQSNTLRSWCLVCCSVLAVVVIVVRLSLLRSASCFVGGLAVKHPARGNRLRPSPWSRPETVLHAITLAPQRIGCRSNAAARLPHACRTCNKTVSSLATILWMIPRACMCCRALTSQLNPQYVWPSNCWPAT